MRNWTRLDWLGVCGYVATGGLSFVGILGTKPAAYAAIVTGVCSLITKAYANAQRPAPSVIAGAPIVNPDDHSHELGTIQPKGTP